MRRGQQLFVRAEELGLHPRVELGQNERGYVVIDYLRGDHRVQQLQRRSHAAGGSGVQHELRAEALDEQLRRDGCVDLAHAGKDRNHVRAADLAAVEAELRALSDCIALDAGKEWSELLIAGAENSDFHGWSASLIF